MIPVVNPDNYKDQAVAFKKETNEFVRKIDLNFPIEIPIL
jgi:hypothetical protein